MINKWMCIVLYSKYSLSAPPNCCTASINLAWRSGVHFNLGLASVERTSPESPEPFPVWRNICLSEGIGILEEEWMFFPWCCWWVYIQPAKPLISTVYYKHYIWVHDILKSIKQHNHLMIAPLPDQASILWMITLLPMKGETW